MLYEFKVVQNSLLSQSQLLEIATLKNQYWSHTIDSQIKWLERFYRDGDRHIIAYNGALPVAYSGLVCRECQIDRERVTFLGVGNVCVDEKKRGTGLGKILVEVINGIIMQERVIGLLLCHSDSVAFYVKCGWINIKYEKCSVNEVSFKEQIMGFNGVTPQLGQIFFQSNF